MGVLKNLMRKIFPPANRQMTIPELDKLVLDSETQLRFIRQQIAACSIQEADMIQNLKNGSLGGREKEFALLAIKRDRVTMESLKSKAEILNKNIEAHMNTIGKLWAMEAIALRNIDSEMLERVVLDFEEGMDAYTKENSIELQPPSTLTSQHREELHQLENEILGSKAAEKTPTKVAKTEEVLPKTLVKEKPQKTRPSRKKTPDRELEF